MFLIGKTKSVYAKRNLIIKPKKAPSNPNKIG